MLDGLDATTLSMQPIDAETTHVSNIYQSSLDARFLAIRQVIAKDLGFGENLNALTAERQCIVQDQAEQSIVDWAVHRANSGSMREPVTNFQHLLEEYCSLAEHL